METDILDEVYLVRYSQCHWKQWKNTSRAIGDKCDFIGIMRLATPDFLKTVEPLIKQFAVKPDVFIDICKNRGSKYKRVRLWRKVDLGALRSEDLFLTDEYGTLVPLDLITSKAGDLDFNINDIIHKEKKVIKPKEFTITV